MNKRFPSNLDSEIMIIFKGWANTKEYNFERVDNNFTLSVGRGVSSTQISMIEKCYDCKFESVTPYAKIIDPKKPLDLAHWLVLTFRM